MQAVEVGVTRVGCRDTVDGTSGGDAILLHAGNDAVLGPGRAGEHKQSDDDPQQRRAESERAREVVKSEQQDDDSAGDESFMMQDVEALCDDGAGRMRVGDGAERGPRSDGKEEEPAEPHDECEPNDGAEQGFHAGTGYKVEGAGYRELGAENVCGSGANGIR